MRAFYLFMAALLAAGVPADILARTYFLPDYQSEFYSGNRVQDSDSGHHTSTPSCSDYGLFSAPQNNADCQRVSPPAPGLICYSCTICSSDYAYDSSNCSGDYVTSGSSCGGKYNQCICDRSKFPVSSGGCPDDQKADTANSCKGPTDTETYYQCIDDSCAGLTDNTTDLGCQSYYRQCPSLCEIGKTCVPNDCSEYTLTSCPEGDDCYSCTVGCGNETTRYICAENYCANHTLEVCPDDAVCSSCSPGCGDYNTYYRITGCPDGTFNMGSRCAPVAGEIAFTVVAEEKEVLALYINLWDGLDGEWDVFAIDWGDGRSMKETPSASTEHTYSAGTYDVVLTGNISHFQINGKKTTVQLAKIDSLDLETVINYQDAFYDNSYFCKEAVGGIPKLPDGLQRADRMFGLCSGLTGNVPELPDGLTSASRMFYGCEGLTGGVPVLPDSLVAVESMFESCSGLDGQITNLPSGIKIGDSMFRFCTNLSGEVPPLPDSLIRGYKMFQGCQNLSGGIPELPVSLQNGEWMFYMCSGLSGETPAKPAGLTNCTEMFYGTRVDLGSDWPSSAK